MMEDTSSAQSRKYTLSQAAVALRVSVITLKKWLDKEGIEPALDGADRRARVISDTDLSRLRQTYKHRISPQHDSSANGDPLASGDILDEVEYEEANNGLTQVNAQLAESLDVGSNTLEMRLAELAKATQQAMERGDVRRAREIAKKLTEVSERLRAVSEARRVASLFQQDYEAVRWLRRHLAEVARMCDQMMAAIVDQGSIPASLRANSRREYQATIQKFEQLPLMRENTAPSEILEPIRMFLKLVGECADRDATVAEVWDEHIETIDKVAAPADE